MAQLSFFGDRHIGHIVNVASVPQRSPFRYPGGKTWLVPRVRQWLKSLSMSPVDFIEPFAGGGIIGLTVAFEYLADHVTLVELDEQVAAVWKTILNGDAQWLADRISEFDCTLQNVQVVLSEAPRSLEEEAFQTILKNRVYHGGILAPGSSLIKYGENGKGIKSRWYPETLKRRIINITRIKDRLTFIEGDGMEVVREKANSKDIAFFIDPPYTVAGKKAGTRLYKHFKLDHKELFKVAMTLTGDFLMTYDNTDEITKLAKAHSLDVEPIAMKNTHNAKMTELLIGRNLDWLCSPIS